MTEADIMWTIIKEGGRDISGYQREHKDKGVVVVKAGMQK